jgi:hypothetical protein
VPASDATHQTSPTLGIELDPSLADEPRFLTDARFLSVLRLELSERLGVEDARSALLQLGFVHGLRDAMRAIRASGLFRNSGSPASARIAMRFATRPSVAERRPLEVRGSWPQKLEAESAAPPPGASPAPSCYASSGYTSGWLSALFDADILAVETSCRAHGDEACCFMAREDENWLASGDPVAASLLQKLPFHTLRSVVSASLVAPQSESLVFDPDSPAVHVWGPVMVVPFAGPEETMRAIDLIGQDAGARDVSVVVLDLAGTLLDEGFGAVALERVLDAIESWGAEPVLAGVSPLSERIVADLERGNLILHKDLEAAIAAAFQIADASRWNV